MLAMVLIIMVGLAIDTAWVLWVAYQLQVTADGAALSGALVVREDIIAAHDQPIVVGYANYAAGDPVQLVPNPSNVAEGDVVIGEYLIADKLFSPTLSEPNAVKAVARRTTDSPNGPVPLIFGPIFGFNTWNVTRHAIAVSGGGKNIGIIVLNESQDKALHIFGDPTLDVDRRGVQVNSGNETPGAAFGAGNYTIAATDVNIVGGTTLAPEKVTGDLKTGQRSMPDPLAWMAVQELQPTLKYAGTEFMTDKGTVTLLNDGDTLTISPGYYSGGIDENGGTLTLLPGIYVLDGIGLKVGANANFYAEGVMLFITGTGFVHIGGGGTVIITPLERSRDYSPYDPVPDGCEKIYEGISIWQDASGTPTEDGYISGSSTMDINGMLYLPSAHVDVGGTGGSFGNSLICDTMKAFGTANILIDYDDKYTVPAGGCYLVE